MRLLAAMSGGVDSAVAAALAVEAGHDVTGVHLALAQIPDAVAGARGCCSREDARDASRAADVLGIAYYVWDLSERFRTEVVDDFVAEYAAGRTPNPCLRCNEHIKFSAVLDRALMLGFDAVVTGHHARLSGGRLRRSVDQAKDQSYVLAVLTPAQLARTVLPLGDRTKDQVRAYAAERGLAVAQKPDSHDVCFVPHGDTRAFLADRLGERPGPVVDALTGDVLGSHDGTYGFTVGQRRGLDLTVPAPDGRPRFVLSVEPVSRTVTVGPREALDVWSLTTGPGLWTSGSRELPLRCDVQLRAHGAAHAATVVGGPDGWRVQLDEPAQGLAAGQAVVLYDGDEVLGSATLASTEARTPIGS